MASDTNVPPEVDAGSDQAGPEGSAVSLGGSASDGDGDTLAYQWTYAPGPGIDAGAGCQFGDPASPATTFICDDDGEFTVTLSVDDGTNPAVTDSATVTLSNVSPTVSITSPSDGGEVNVGSTVNLAASFSDPGSNDTHTCTVDWGDGTVEAGTITAGSCTAGHSYGSLSVPTITVTVTDDDGGSGSDEIMLIVTSKSAKVTGGGFLFDGFDRRVNLGLVAKSGPDGLEGQIQVRIHKSHKFHGTNVDSLTASGKTVTWTGSGRRDGQDGYRYEATVEDRGNGKSKKGQPDLFSITIYDAVGNIVYQTSGGLEGGNLKVH